MPPESNPASLTLGQRLRRRRWQELRVFQETLARAVAISPAQLCEIERGTAGTTERTLAKLAIALDLDFAELRAQALAEGRLELSRDRLPTGAPLPEVPLATTLPRVPSRPQKAPTKRWLTTAEAGELLGMKPGSVRSLLRSGRLTPAVRVPKSKHGQRHWLVAAAAVVAYEPPNQGRYWPPRPVATPPGYLSLRDAAEAVGLPTATFHRRLHELGIPTLRESGRRWVPADAIATMIEAQGEARGA